VNTSKLNFFLFPPRQGVLRSQKLKD